ncbi:iron-containing alcohol dehydrogenase [Clostridium tertium]|uniref:1,3-propanediol dehydrogenase n=1 Tax=Clostridium tertium TaxID=1559 RepID=A0A6N3E449_9CLOT
MANLFVTPKYIITGENALSLSKDYLEKFGNKAFIVTDEMMVKLGALEKVLTVLKEINLEYEIFSEVNSEPTDLIVEKGIRKYKESNSDFLIALGGGSPIDAMKAIGAMISNEGEIVDYLGKVIPNEPPVLVAIPTTAGTGSEATQFTIISDTKNNVKMLLKGPSLIPTLAIVDPVFTVTAPKQVTAATGVDALCHAIEAYTSRKAQPMSDTFAISAIKRIFENLSVAYENGENLKAREEMSIASLEAGIAFNNSSVTIVHGMSRPIGALFHVPHGLSNAMLLDECLKFAKDGAIEKFDKLAQAIGVYKEGMSKGESATEFVLATSKLLSKLNIQTLDEFGVDKEEFMNSVDKMASDALVSGSPQNTMRIPTKEEIIDIYKRLWK